MKQHSISVGLIKDLHPSHPPPHSLPPPPPPTHSPPPPPPPRCPLTHHSPDAPSLTTSWMHPNSSLPRRTPTHHSLPPPPLPGRSPTHHSLDISFLLVHFIDPQDVVAEIEGLKLPLLTKQTDQHTASPLKSLSTPLPTNKHTHTQSQQYSWLKSIACLTQW